MISLEEVYREYSDMIYRWLLARTGDEDLAEEITQETFYQAVLHADRYDGSCKVSTWLCSIASNKLKEYYRKHPQTAEFPEEYVLPGSDTASEGFGDGSGEKSETSGDRRRGSVPGSAVLSVPSAEDQVMDASQKMGLYRAIHSLPEPSREVVHLRAFADLSFKEIGDIFGKSENWARVTYFRAKAALRKELTENE